jgi:hypothetical protein
MTAFCRRAATLLPLPAAYPCGSPRLQDFGHEAQQMFRGTAHARAIRILREREQSIAEHKGTDGRIDPNHVLCDLDHHFDAPFHRLLPRS